MKKSRVLWTSLVFTAQVAVKAFAAVPEVGESAPTFKLQTQEAKDFDLSARKGQWTVLYFYPKANTPGCTKQACAFRDNIKKIRDLGAEVYGISTNTVPEQAAFHKKHNLNFPLLADSEAAVSKLYGTKIPLVNISRRWTYLIGPDLKIRALEKDVDPILDATKIAQKLQALQAL